MGYYIFVLLPRSKSVEILASVYVDNRYCDAVSAVTDIGIRCVIVDDSRSC